MNGDERDEQLRLSLLTAARILGEHKNGGWVSGASLADAAKAYDGRGVDGDAHAISLLQDLKGVSLIEEEAQQHLSAQATALRHRRFRLSLKGRELWMQAIPPVPGVWDDRLGQ